MVIICVVVFVEPRCRTRDTSHSTPITPLNPENVKIMNYETVTMMAIVYGAEAITTTQTDKKYARNAETITIITTHEAAQRFFRAALKVISRWIPCR